MMHNLNVIMVACEMYFGRSRIQIYEIGMAPFFGLVYVAFSWWWAPRAQVSETNQVSTLRRQSRHK